MSKLVIFTESFPYGTGETFLKNEILIISKFYSTIIIVPFKISSKKTQLPNNVIIDNSFAKKFSQNKFLRIIKGTLISLFSIDFYKEVLQLKNLSNIQNLFRFISKMKICYWWIKKTQYQKHSTLFYTYWLYDQTAALAKIKQKNPSTKFISRAHGFDLYDDSNHIPMRAQTLKYVSKVFTISNNGKTYLQNKYPDFKSKITSSYLGIKPQKIHLFKEPSCELKIVSCASIIPLKRINLIVKLLIELSNKNPHTSFIWNHFGNGYLKEEITEQLIDKAPKNLKWKIKGYFQNKELLDHYKSHYYDLFISMSSSEGIPVSMMEAMSFGIPVLTTNVGGVKELVNNENGYLLPQTNLIQSASRIIKDILLNPLQLKNKRSLSHQATQLLFNYKENFSSLAKKFKTINQ